MNGPKLERPLHLDMDFGEALRRYVQTKPDEVQPAPGQRQKNARPNPAPEGTREPRVRPKGVRPEHATGGGQGDPTAADPHDD